MKKYFIAKKCYHDLDFQQVMIFLLMEGLAFTLRLLTDEGSGC